MSSAFKVYNKWRSIGPTSLLWPPKIAILTGEQKDLISVQIWWYCKLSKGKCVALAASPYMGGMVSTS